MCCTNSARYPLVLRWHEERHTDELHDRRLLDVVAPAFRGVEGQSSVEQMTLVEGITVIAMRPFVLASVIGIVAECDTPADGLAVQGVVIAGTIRRGTTTYRKRGDLGIVVGMLAQTPFGPRPYPWW